MLQKKVKMEKGLFRVGPIFYFEPTLNLSLKRYTRSPYTRTIVSSYLTDKKRARIEKPIVVYRGSQSSEPIELEFNQMNHAINKIAY